MIERARLVTLLAVALTLAGCGDDTPPDGAQPMAQVADDAADLVLAIHADGAFTLHHHRETGAFEIAKGSLGLDSPADQQKAIDRVRSAATGAVLSTGGAQPSSLLALIEVDANCKWKYVQWMLQAFASHGIQIHKIGLRHPGEEETTRIDLPMDRGLDEPRIRDGLPDEPQGEVVEEVPEEEIEGGVPKPDTPVPGTARGKKPAPKFVLRVFRKRRAVAAEAFTRIRVGSDSTIDLPPSGAPDPAKRKALYRKIEDLAKAGAASSNGAAEVKAPPPSGGSTPTGDVLELIRTLRRAGYKTIWFEGAALPMGR